MSAWQLHSVGSRGWRGVTLIEILVVIVLFCFLTAVLLPVLVAGQRRGLFATDISKMHQVSMAGAMYEQSFGEFPLLMSETVDAHLLDPKMCFLNLDPFKRGIANHFESALTKIERSRTAYPQSFICLGSLGYPLARAVPIFQANGAGWAVTSTNAHNIELADSFWGDDYWRICVDGSVRKEPVPRMVVKDQTGVISGTIEYRLFFMDESR
jgi:prepilin-type N-terminal cleavage/methylation domain-containing protein